MSRTLWIRILLGNATLAVAGMVLILVPSYPDSVRHTEEALLRDDLFTMRSVIDQYTLDKQKAPQSLQDVVAAGYLKSIPVDPFTGRRDTWRIERDEFLDPPLSTPPIYDVHSGSTLISFDGTPYSSW